MQVTKVTAQDQVEGQLSSALCLHYVDRRAELKSVYRVHWLINKGHVPIGMSKRCARCEQVQFY